MNVSELFKEIGYMNYYFTGCLIVVLILFTLLVSPY
jgi:hypothetical protein